MAVQQEVTPVVHLAWILYGRHVALGSVHTIYSKLSRLANHSEICFTLLFLWYLNSERNDSCMLKQWNRIQHHADDDERHSAWQVGAQSPAILYCLYSTLQTINNESSSKFSPPRLMDNLGLSVGKLQYITASLEDYIASCGLQKLVKVYYGPTVTYYRLL